MWRLRVDKDRCIGSGSCQGLAPQRFGMDAGNRAYPLLPAVEPDELVLDAAASCPVEAILIVDLETGERVDPD